PGRLRSRRGRGYDRDALTDGQLDRESRAAGRDVLDGHPPAMCFYDADGHAQPEPGAFPGRLRREEGVKDLAEVLGRNAGTVVLDHHGDLACVNGRALGEAVVAAGGLKSVLCW